MLIASVHHVIGIQSDITAVRSKFRREIVRSDCSLRLVLSLMKHKIVCGSENQDLDWLIETQP